MGIGDRFFWIVFIGIWSIFILWEIQIQTMAESLLIHVIRFDLFVLPILLFFTGYAVYEKRKNRK